MRQFIKILILIFLGINNLKAQNDRIESDGFLYWQFNTKISFIDFKHPVDSVGIKLCEEYGTKSLSNVQIHSVMDYPKKARKIKSLKEKIYFAPVFCKNCSMILEKDTNELKMAQMYFDIAEYCSRRARQNILQLDSLNEGNGFTATAFPGIVNHMYKMMGEMFGDFSRQVKIDKIPGAYDKWRSDCDKLLFETINFATTKKECMRFIKKKPYSEEYTESYAVYGQDIK
jgi:hypothetical protein